MNEVWIGGMVCIFFIEVFDLIECWMEEVLRGIVVVYDCMIDFVFYCNYLLIVNMEKEM